MGQYEPEWYFWEFVLLVYKGLMTGALCIIGNTTIFQPMAATIFQVVYLMGVLKTGPYKNFDLDISSTTSSLVLFLAALCSIVLFAEGRTGSFSEGHTADVETIGTFLIVITSLNLVIESVVIIVKLNAMDKCCNRSKKQPPASSTSSGKPLKQTKNPSATKVEPVVAVAKEQLRETKKAMSVNAQKPSLQEKKSADNLEQPAKGVRARNLSDGEPAGPTGSREDLFVRKKPPTTVGKLELRRQETKKLAEQQRIAREAGDQDWL